LLVAEAFIQAQSELALVHMELVSYMELLQLTAIGFIWQPEAGEYMQ